MAGTWVEEDIRVREELIKKACSMAMKAHRNPDKQYLSEKTRNSSDIVFAFPGSWSANEWFTHKPFGETTIDRTQFPSLRSIGKDEDSIVNEAFLARFQLTFANRSLQNEVDKAVKERKQVVFTGHSSGGAIAILMTVQFLETYQKPDITKLSPLCVTFGSPLVGDRIFNHALGRENWTRHFIHFVMKYDIIPRVMLAPRTSIMPLMQQILHLLNPRSSLLLQGALQEASAFYFTVMKNASSVASHAACQLMGNTNPLLETLSSFIMLSPYRPFGTYIFCTGNGKLVGMKNPDAILQLLFYSSQFISDTEGLEVAHRSLKDHQIYQTELQGNWVVSYLDNLDMLPLSSDGTNPETMATNMVLNDLNQSTRARLCLRAAGVAEKQKLENQKKRADTIEDTKKELADLEKYRTMCEVRKIGYYDAFKMQNSTDDFKANIGRLKLTGIWDETIEMLKKYELPDGFEGQKHWIELGTLYRRLVEPLDIANYYRHLKNEDTGPYMMNARPKRYRYTQRWLEHAQGMKAGSCRESCFWAEIEELSRIYKLESFEAIRERLYFLESELKKWIDSGLISKDLLLEESTFVKWWITLPVQHKSVSCIRGFILGP